MSNLLGLAPAALERLFGTEGLETFILGLLHLLDLLLIVLVHLRETSLLPFHFCELFFLEDLHTRYFERFTTENGENRLNLVVEEEKLVVLDQCLF